MNSTEETDKCCGTCQPDPPTKLPSPASSFEGYDFRNVVPPTTSRPNKWTKLSASYIIKDAFQLHTLLAIGAGLQAILSAAAPKPWCFIPTAAALTIAPIVTLIQLVLPHISIRGHRLSHTLLAGIVPGRSTARIPTSTGRYLAQDKNGLVVFHFGARFNHPLGVFAPGARTMTKLFRANLSALEENRSEYGLLGADLFRGGASTRASNDTILLVLYFRDVHGLQRFACSEAHQEAYRWLRVVTTAGQDGSSQKYPHLSAFHETFVVPADGYETLYINTAPILLGNTYIEKEGDDDEQVWLSSLVDADDARLRTMTARLKRSC